MSEKLPWHWFKWFGYLIGLIVFVMAVVGYARNVKALRNQVIADAVTIDGLNKKLDIETQAEETQANFAAECVHELSTRPAVAPAALPDADYVTVLVAQTNSPAAAPAAGSGQDAPLVAIGNLVRPGLGTALAPMLQGQPGAGAAPAPESITKWIIPGRVTPYVSTNGTLAQYAWINVKTQQVEVQPPPQDPRVLLARLGVR
jgi:hypothetical protein